MNKAIDTFWDGRTVFAKRFAMVVLTLFGGLNALAAEPMESAKLIGGSRGVQRTTAEIMADSDVNAPQGALVWQSTYSNRKNLPSNGGSLETAQWPKGKTQSLSNPRIGPSPLAPQTVGTQFDGATGPADTGTFPPNTMGAVGPTQFFVFLNGRLRTFNKTTGVADGVLNVSSNVFFASVLTPAGAGTTTITSNPQVRYDRLSARWFLVMLDLNFNTATGATTQPNRVLIAVSDAASNGSVTGSTVWTLYQFQVDASLFAKDASLGIDASALYVGTDMFTLAGAFNSTKGFVMAKAPLLTASSVTIWAFSGLVATPTGAGPFAPRGVDNYNPNNTGATAEGYFIGVDNATFNTLMLRRVTNPGSLGPAPTISANISIATPLTTRFPVLVPHLGNTGGTNGRLNATDDRLYAAHLRNGRLWTAHNIGVNNTGVAGATNNRNASRWYELQNIIAPGTPSVLQSGTLFDNNAVNDANQRSYWMPSIMVSGQGHAALGCTIAGTNERINAFTTGRLVGDTLGTLRNGPGGAALPGYTASAFAYNPPGDPGGPSRRWGECSFTSLDPLDDMTIWTIQEYCNGTNTYGVRVAELLAPPPVTPNTANPPNVASGQSSVNVVISGVSNGTIGFYDPGPNLAAPALGFHHIVALVSGGVVVNSTTFNSPTQLTLNINTTGATQAAQTVTVQNPDGQAVTSGPILNVVNPLSLTGAVSRKNHAATPFDVILPLTGAPGIECRIGGGGGTHTFVFTFSNNVTGGSASVTSGVGSVSGSPSFSTNTITVNLTGVTDQQKITVTLSGVTDTFAQVLPDTAVSANMLIGDTSGSKAVNGTDVLQTKSQSGLALNAGNFRTDVTAGGSINGTDVSAVKANSGHGVP